MRILILHGIENVESARRTSINHAFFLPKYAPQHDYVFQGVNHPLDPSVEFGRFDVILIDTTYLCWRWAKPRADSFDRILDRFAFVARSSAVKIAFPQDDYDHCAYLDDWLADWKIDIIATPYSRFSYLLLPRASAQADVHLSLTGYLDGADAMLADRVAKPFGERSIDVGYRARKLPAYFGSFGQLKADIASRFTQAAAGRGLALDISTREADSLNGDAWLAFLGNSRFTLGTPSGSSLADPVGDIRRKVNAFIAEHPGAAFEDVAEACFPGLDGVHQYDTVSPRIFESALAGTCQILSEGTYVPGMKPGEHYIQLDRDFGNFEDVWAEMANEAENERRIRATRALLLSDEGLTYRGLARNVLGWISDTLERRGVPFDRAAVTAVASDDPAERHAGVIEGLRIPRTTGPGDRTVAPPRACLLSLSKIPDDPRVRRQGDALFHAGWSVAAVGQPGARSKRPVWPSYDASHPAPVATPGLQAEVEADSASVVEPSVPAATRGMKVRKLVKTVARQTLPAQTHESLRQGYRAGRRVVSSALAPYHRLKSRAGLALRIQRTRVSTQTALDMYWSWTSIQELYQSSKGIEADLWVANDWLMLPLAARLAEERGGVFVYDTHEFAVNEYMERLKWRLFNRPVVKAIESAYIGRAKVVSTVSDGIADGLQRVYRLPSRPMLIRNTPLYQSVQPSPETEKIRVLYHGIVAPVRGLEPMIRSVKHWRPEFAVTIRGPGNDDYLEGLRRLIEREGVADRVTLAPPVPMTALVQEAAAFDVGFFCMPRLSKQHEYVLPNKLFEYIMAGLAVCVSDLPEMSRIVNATGAGVLLPNADEVGIARVVNGLTRDSIRAYKARSLDVARELCWEQEAKALLSAYAGAIGRA